MDGAYCEVEPTQGVIGQIRVPSSRMSTSVDLSKAFVIGTDGGVSGRWGASAAVIARNGRVVGDEAYSLRSLHGYALAAEIAAVALAARRANRR